MQGSIPPKSDNRAIGGELSFENAPDKAIFGLLLLPSTVLEERIFRFPFTFASRSGLDWEGVAGNFSNAELEDVDEFKFNLFRR
jgi:hypothetical protein